MGKVIVACAVWDEFHCDLLTKWHVPSLMLPGNLGSLREFGAVDVLLLTKTSSREKLDLAVKALQCCADIRAVHVHEFASAVFEGWNRYAVMTRMQQFAVRMAIATRSALVWTHPDSMLAEGTYAALGHPRDLEDQEVGCVLEWHPSVDATEFYQDGLVQHPSLQGRKPCMDLILKKMHHTMQRVQLFNPKTDWPSALWAPAPGGLVAHGFHLNLHMCWPTAGHPAWRQALDVEFTQLGSFRRGRVVTLKHHVCFELCIAEKSYNNEGPVMSVKEVGAWGRKHATEAAMRDFTKQIIIGDAELHVGALARAKAIQTAAWDSLPG